MPRLVQANLAPAAGALCCYPARSLVGRLAICAVFRNDLRGLFNGNPVFLCERLGLVGLRGRGGVLLLCHDGFLEMTNQPRVVRALCRVSLIWERDLWTTTGAQGVQELVTLVFTGRFLGTDRAI